MNRHPLTADFNMYYSGTYIFRDGPDGPEAMLVEGTTKNGDDTAPEGVTMTGMSWNEKGEIGYANWHGGEISQFRPVSGYFALGGKTRKNFLTFSVSNRTQRKGFDGRTVISNGMPSNMSGPAIVSLYRESQGLDSRPGPRDIFISGKVVNWKGVAVGDLDDAGKYIPRTNFKQFEGLICQLLQNI